MITTGHCVYTGARVLFAEYGCVFSADLHAVGDCIVVNFNPASGEANKMRDYSDAAQRGATHTVTLGMSGFCREAKGVAVIPREALTGPLR